MTPPNRKLETAAQVARLAASTPAFRVGDVWSGVWDSSVEIVDWSPQEELPWPLLSVRWPSGKVDAIGATALRGATLVVQGEGRAWSPDQG